MAGANQYVYDAFISYKRSDGTRPARWLRRALLHYRLPRALHHRRPGKLSVYMDTIYERATQDFFETNIKPALWRSRHLVVVVTKDLLQSNENGSSWVERELEEFSRTPQRNNVVVVQAGGGGKLRLPGRLEQDFPNIEVVGLHDLTPTRFVLWPRWWRLRDEFLKIAAAICEVPDTDMPVLRREERNRSLRMLGAVSFVFAVVLTGMSVLAGVAYRSYLAAERSRSAEHDAQVRALLDAQPQAVPDLIKSLPADGAVIDRLRRHWSTPNDRSQRLRPTRAALALLALRPDDDATTRSRLLLLRWMADAEDPHEVVLIRDALLKYRDQLKGPLWQAVMAVDTSRQERFHRLVALASYDPWNGQWKALGGDVVNELVRANPLHLGVWTDAFRPVRAALMPPLIERFGDRTRDEGHYVAANLLRSYAADQTEVLVTLVERADPQQFARIYPLLESKAHRQPALDLLRQRLAPASTALVSAERNRPIVDERALSGNAQLAVTMVRLGAGDAVWPLLRHGGDGGWRSHLIHALGPLGSDVQLVLDRLKTETDISVRRALVLSLGQFGSEQVSRQQQEVLRALMLEWYLDDPDPGIHGAVDWLLRQSRRGSTPRKLDWRGAGDLEKLDQTLAGGPRAKRDWYVTKTGHTMTIVRGPARLWLSVSNEPDGDRTFRKTIKRSFAISTKEVTVAQYRAFKKDGLNSQAVRHGPDDDAPALGLNWYEAALYCNWLSEREGRRKCYVPRLDGAFNIDSDDLNRPCYRLPTEAEWEAAARAGSKTAHFFGSAPSLLREYAWHHGADGDAVRAWPVGQLKPNDLGLFDVYGNAAEWTHDRAGLVYLGKLKQDPFLHQRRSNRKDDEEDNLIGVDPGWPRVIKGGSFYERGEMMRSGSSNPVPASQAAVAFGFRVATTIGGVARDESADGRTGPPGAEPPLRVLVDHSSISFRTPSRFAWPRADQIDACLQALTADQPLQSGEVRARYFLGAPPVTNVPEGFTELLVRPAVTPERLTRVGSCLRDLLADATTPDAEVEVRIPFRVAPGR